jgi:hypothetical protein
MVVGSQFFLLLTQSRSAKSVYTAGAVFYLFKIVIKCFFPPHEVK